MKKTLIFYFLVALSLACTKDTGEVPVNPTETLPDSFTKRVLLEDYSKHCPFCLPLNLKLDSMRSAYPNNSLIPVIIGVNHSTQIAYFDSVQPIFDVRTTPSGSVNRIPATNAGLQNGKLVYNSDYWPSHIDREILKSPNYGLTINSELKDNFTDIEVSMGSLETNNKLKLSVFIIENDAYYRTLKRVLTPFKGSNLDLKRDEITKHIFISVNVANYDVSKTSVVAFIHHFDETTQNFEVVNAQEVKLGENSGW